MITNLIIDHIEVSADFEISPEEAHEYVKYARHKYCGLSSIKLTLDGEYINMVIVTEKPFDRIRRITGYLVGTMDKWNNGKKAEERDRVKHEI